MALKPNPGGVPREADAPWQAVVLLCRKCADKRADAMEAAGREPLRRALKRLLKAGGMRSRVRVVESGCLDLCPKDGQTVLLAGPGRPGRLLVFRPGDDPEALVAALGLAEAART